LAVATGLQGDRAIAESGIFWDILLRLIEEAKVVPVVGQDLLRIPGPSGTRLLHSYLAERLAAYLGVPNETLSEGCELNEVACRFLSQGGQVEDVYPALKTVAQETEMLGVPEPLLQLAAIPPLQLFVTTTFDSFLVRALNHTRFKGNLKTQVLSYSPGQVEDVSPEFKSFGRPIVYHLFGKVSATPAYVVTQEDLVEFFHSLQSETRHPKILFDELNRKSLLILGCRFSGWLTRLLIRMSKAQRLSSGGKSDYLADTEVNGDPSLVMFLKHFCKATKIFTSGNAVEFVAELHQRWVERHGDTSVQATVVAEGVQSDVEAGAVFLSYASEDLSVAEKIKQALEAPGVDVFLDRKELHPGEDWEAKLRRSIHQCSVFVPLISRQTLTPSRRFFRAEWKLALREDEKASFSDEEVFLLPVVIDDTSLEEPAIPSRFRAAQWTLLPTGQPTDEFVKRVQHLYRKYQKFQIAAR